MPGDAAAALGRGARVEVDDVPGREAVAQRADAVDLPQRHRHLGDHVRLAEVGLRHHAAGEELGDERGRLVEVGDDLGPDAAARPRGGRLALARAVDAEQRRVLAREPHDDVAPAVAGAQVVVGDAAAERLRRHLGRAEQRLEPGRQQDGGGGFAVVLTCASVPRRGMSRQRSRAARRSAGPPRGHTADCGLRLVGGAHRRRDLRAARAVVDGAEDQDRAEHRPQDRDLVEEVDAEVEHPVGLLGLRVRRHAVPHEVDQHRAAPHEREDVDEHPPAAERERHLAALEEAAPPRLQDRQVGEDVGQVDHPARRDRDVRDAAVLEEEDRGHQRDEDAGADRRAGASGARVLERARERELAVARHRVGEPDRRGLDRQAADEDRRTRRPAGSRWRARWRGWPG